MLITTQLCVVIDEALFNERERERGSLALSIRSICLETVERDAGWCIDTMFVALRSIVVIVLRTSVFLLDDVHGKSGGGHYSSQRSLGGSAGGGGGGQGQNSAYWNQAWVPQEINAWLDQGKWERERELRPPLKY